jgi:phage-related protein
MGGLMLDLTQHGETGRQAISSLTSAFTGIISPTAAVTAAQQSMGLSFINAKTGGLDPLKQILTELQPVLAGHSAAEDAATLKTLGFGAASTKLAETFAAGPAVLQKYTDEVTKAGSAQDAAAKQASTMKGELDKLKSGAGDLMTELGTVLVPVLTKVVGGLLDFANAISTHIPLIQKIIGVIGQWALVLAGPIGWLVLLYIHMAGFRAAVADFVSVAVGDFGKAIAFIKQIVGDVTSWISAHWTQIVDDAQIAWNIVSTFIKIAWQVISTIISVALAVIVPILEVAWSVIYNAVTIAWTLISTIIGTAITVIIAVIKTIVAIVTFLVGVWQTVTSDVSGFIGGVVKFFSDLPGKIMGAISGIYSTVGGFLKGVWNTVSSDVGTAIGNVVTWFTGLPGKIKNALSGALTWLFDIGKNIITGLLNGIKSAMNDVKNFVTGIAGSIMSWKGPLDYDATILIPHGNAIMAGLVAGIQQGLNGPVKAALGQVTSTIAGTSLSPMSLGAGNLAVAGGGGGGIGGAASGRQINITYNIPVTGDMSPQTALYVRQQFDQHDQQLITTLNAL